MGWDLDMQTAAPLELTGFASRLVDRGLKGLAVAEQVDAFCRDLVDAGFRASRFNMSIGTLHPRHGAQSYVWRPDGIATELHPRRRNPEEEPPHPPNPPSRTARQVRVRLRSSCVPQGSAP